MTLHVAKTVTMLLSFLSDLLSFSSLQSGGGKKCQLKTSVFSLDSPCLNISCLLG